MTPDPNALSSWLDHQRTLFEAALMQTTAGFVPDAFAEIGRYPLQTGGKRFRPLLALSSAATLNQPPELALGSALALELVHTYSLVHDDLPCMDDDSERRGKPTLHVLHGDAIAVLAGDALLTEAFSVIAHHYADQPTTGLRLVAELAYAAGGAGMVAGQYLDITATPSITEAQLLTLHGAKTGALIRAACRMGALAAQATDAQLAALTTYGEAIGLAFQLQDDILDADQDSDPQGPPSFIKLLGIEGTRARAQAELDRALQAIATLPNPAILTALAHFTLNRNI